VSGEVEQSTIYAKFGESSCKKVFKKQKIMPWFTERDDVINITSLPAPGGGISCSGQGRQIVLLLTVDVQRESTTNRWHVQTRGHQVGVYWLLAEPFERMNVLST